MSNSLVAVHLELITEWSEKNLPLTPDNVTFGSNKIQSGQRKMKSSRQRYLSVHTRKCYGNVNWDTNGLLP